jgi:RimJ/RimL family protein N-acetyltransferase
MANAPAGLALCRAGPEDSRRLWQWRNEDETRQASFQTDPIPFEQHERWFAERLRDPHTRLFLILEDGRPVGYVRFDLAPPEAEINLSLDPTVRGRGLGAAVIRLASERIRSEGITTVRARVRPENARSVAAFRRAGYVPSGTVRVGEAEAVELVFAS